MTILILSYLSVCIFLNSNGDYALGVVLFVYGNFMSVSKSSY